MNNSILLSIKKLLGLDANYNPFDQDIIIHINSVFMIIFQIGLGPSKPYYITSETETWDDFTKDVNLCNLVKSYMYLKVRLVFDPPTTGVLHEAMERQIKEFEWRLMVQNEDMGLELNHCPELPEYEDSFIDDPDDYYEEVVADE